MGPSFRRTENGGERTTACEKKKKKKKGKSNKSCSFRSLHSLFSFVAASLASSTSFFRFFAPSKVHPFRFSFAAFPLLCHCGCYLGK